MSHVQANPYFFHAEATLPPNSPCYVVRAADAALEKALRERRYVVMLSSRKVGKSSLMEQTFARLQGSDMLVAKHELAEAGESVNEEGWYAGLIQALVKDAKRRNQFIVKDDWRAWWQEQGQIHHIPPGQRFSDFLYEYFLLASEKPWVIAIDEIDTTIPLGFSDDFFASLRRCQNARASDPVYGRLTFLLAGVASPSQLIKDNRRTPFNIGHAVNLTDFVAEEAKVLLRGIGLPEDGAHPVLLRVLYWTGGHPYLTQSLFRHLADGLEQIAAPQQAGEWEKLVDGLVNRIFLHASMRTNESHFDDIARRRIGGLQGKEKRRTLTIYRQALRSNVVKDNALSAPIVELKLCGLLVCDSNDAAHLVVRNQVYRRVFDAKWVQSEMPKDRWQGIAAASMVVMVLALGVAAWQADQAEKNKILALSAQIQRADADVPHVAFAELKKIKGQERQADKLLGQYWANQARRASLEQPRDQAALMWLKALSVDETAENRLQARSALGAGLQNNVLTLRHQDRVWQAVFSPDGRRLLTASSDGGARLWDAASAQPVGKALQHGNTVFAANFSPDGRRVVTASADNTARLWDAESGQPLGKVMPHRGAVWHAAFSPDGRQVVTASGDKTARVWDGESGRPLGEPLQHQGQVLHAVFSPDSQRVLTASDDKTARVWDALSGRPLGKPLQHQGQIYHAVFSPDGRRALSASLDKTARLWDVESGQVVGKPMQHQDKVYHAVFSPDARRILTASRDNTASLWDAESGQALGKPMTHQAIVRHAVFSPDGRRVLTASYDNSARLWDAETGQALGNPLLHQNPVIHAVFSPDGRQVLTASRDNSARLWDGANGQPMGKAIPQLAAVYALVFSPDGRRFASADLHHSVQQWDSVSAQPIGKPIQHESLVYYLAFSPDGRWLLTASQDDKLRLWDVANGQLLGKPIVVTRRITSATFSPDARRLLTSSDDKSARLWDTASGQALARPLQHKDTVRYAAFSPDGRRLVTASKDKTAQLWDADSGQALGKAMQPDSEVYYAAFSPDGRRLVTASNDKTAQLWDADSGQALAKPILHQDAVNYAAFSPDSSRLITCTAQTLNWFALTPQGEARLEATRWANGAQWFSNPVAIDPSASTLRIADAWTGDTPLIRDVSVLTTAEPGLPELPPGKPAELLARYQRAFALRFADENKSPKLVPVHPVEVPK